MKKKRSKAKAPRKTPRKKPRAKANPHRGPSELQRARRDARVCRERHRGAEREVVRLAGMVRRLGGNPYERLNPAKHNPKARLYLQALLFARPHWTVEHAKAWARRHACDINGRRVKCRAGSVELTPAFIHLRQSDPRHFAPGSIRTVRLGKGIEARMGHRLPRKGKKR